MSLMDASHRVASDGKNEPTRDGSTLTNRLKFMRKIKRSEKRRPNTVSVHLDITADGFSKEVNASSEMVTAKLSESPDKLTKSLTDENDSLRNKNTTLRYQVELLSEQLNDLRDVNVDLRNQNSRIREENSILRNEQSQLTARNDCLVEQIILLQKMLEDLGVSVNGDGMGEVDADDVGDEGTDGVTSIVEGPYANGFGGNRPRGLSGSNGTPASYRKPPPQCDGNLNFL